MKRRLLPAALLLGVLIILSGCSEYSSSGSDFYAGETLTPARLAEISGSVAAGTEPGTTKEKETKSPDTDGEGNIIVYWTKSGSVWHSDRACGSLANSTAVESGTVWQAERAGKSRGCLKCSPEIAGATSNNVESSGQVDN